ncbi:hypothetical protein MVES1_001622 [Malassezia vespertilionis]|uniref:PUM-HD domain-containing protein n=1 Tax=Malassezia vespertilionis TaxID=2020962 RepID=A0A2N1JCK8_9BASI|nr:uncharacterized protein MVES1_001622 [Malassezia vespertilionis]PKI84276.1 hypothetical protein MVES_001524 [Malassezia vespertilionis]WFD06277.1 hypothetical protein MVES1_001622 [Malassezia vespertilionis]
MVLGPSPSATAAPAGANAEHRAAPSALPQGAASMLPKTLVADARADASQVQNGAHRSLAPGEAALFNEGFLFDDELESADDSTFVRKYNLSGDDDKFPMLFRQQGFNNALSTFSSALDLAPLSQMSSRSGRAQPGSNVSTLSPWLHATPTDFQRRVDDIAVADLSHSTHSLSVHDSQHSLAPGAMRPMSSAAPGIHSDARAVRPAAPFSAELFAEKELQPGAYNGLGVAPTPKPGMHLAPGTRPASAHSASFVPIRNGVPVDENRFPAEPPNQRFPRFRGKDESRRKQNGRAFSGEAVSADAEQFRNVRRSDLDPSTTRLEDLAGEMSQLCKDQYGCRFLQKKLEENVPEQCDMIFTETFPYFAELMTDPFGNYLCQKLLEYCSDAQRDQIVDAIAADLVTISLNMHGTRAVQKTIDFISTPSQTKTVIDALSRNVVSLIKDLNGNHVIQKCLNRLYAEQNQFIYDAVAAKCVDVATHRHGCCVLQRCIDHASDQQRFQLAKEITANTLQLVQDPFGNYVVQYVLDLNNADFNEAMVHQFLGNVCMLSMQKFSSNVIEKCIRVSQPSIRKLLVHELIDETRLESLLRDSFANYVVQTSLDYAEPTQRTQLVECIRPILPAIRNTPYGKRIQSRLQRESPEFVNGSADGRFAGPPRGQGVFQGRSGGRNMPFSASVGAGRGRGARRGKGDPMYPNSNVGGGDVQMEQFFPAQNGEIPLYPSVGTLDFTEPAPNVAQVPTDLVFGGLSRGKMQW